MLIVNECNTAMQVDEVYNLTTYTDNICFDSEFIDEYLEAVDVRIRYKAVQGTFSPEHYSKFRS